jgi:DMSO reductase anchor subunit
MMESIIGLSFAGMFFLGLSMGAVGIFFYIVYHDFEDRKSKEATKNAEKCLQWGVVLAVLGVIASLIHLSTMG